MADLLKVFLDANILAKPLTRTLLLVAGPLSGFTSVWSDRALTEAERHLGPGKTPVSDLVTRFGWATGPTGAVDGRFQATDRADRQLLADAAAAGATYIVTENVDDFDEEDLVSVGISGVNPDLFLSVRLTSAAYRTALATIGTGRRRLPRPQKRSISHSDATIRCWLSGSNRSFRSRSPSEFRQSQPSSFVEPDVCGVRRS